MAEPQRGPSQASNSRQRITGMATRLSITLTEPTVARLAAYVDDLSRWSQRIRLTADPRPETIIERHLIDGLMATRLVEPTKTILDVGSGAGIPGLVMAIVLPAQVTLVEPNLRRCAFLRDVAYRLQLGIDVLSARIEDLPPSPSDLVTSRATWPPARWLELATPFVRPGGRLQVFSTRRKALPAAPMGFRDPELSSYRLATDEPRVIATYRKISL